MTPQSFLSDDYSLVPHAQSDNYRYLNLYTTAAETKDTANTHASPHDAAVLVVALARPRKRNALNARFWKEIGFLFGKQVGRTQAFVAIRSVLLVGEGKAFCAGIDVTDASFFPATTPAVRDNVSATATSTTSTDVAHVGLRFLPLLRDMQAAFTALETCPVPVVAAIHGACIGAGMDLVTAADVRLATADSVWSVREVVLGLAADVGTLQRLPKICGNQAWVRTLCLTGRTFDGTEAAAQGLVTGPLAKDVTALWRAGLDLCRTMASYSPVAVRGTKQGLLYARDHSVAEGLEQIAAYNMLALQSREMVGGMQAQFAGETPQYRDLPPLSKL